MTIEATSAGLSAGRIRLGMVGGGEGAFIGGVHRMVARLDDRFDFVAGALASDPDRARRSGVALGLDPDRIYADYATMFAAERARPDGIEAVSIVTPNHVHVPIAIAALNAGLHVICDKPLSSSLAEARKLAAAAAQNDRIIAVTYNYSGYPLVRHAREMIASGQLGALRLVQVEYVQDWLTAALEQTGQKQAEWRTDPERSGKGGAIGDIGTHAFQLAEFMSGQSVTTLSAELHSFVPGRRVDDNAQVSLRFSAGARGTLWASQVAPGNENSLSIRIYGETGGLEWHQEQPNALRYSPFGQPSQTLTRGGAGIGAAGSRVTRIPAGHPEGYLEAFATLYSEVASAIFAARSGVKPADAVMFPMLDDGVRGCAFVEACIQSSAHDSEWTAVTP